MHDAPLLPCSQASARCAQSGRGLLRIAAPVHLQDSRHFSSPDVDELLNDWVPLRLLLARFSKGDTLSTLAANYDWASVLAAVREQQAVSGLDQLWNCFKSSGSDTLIAHASCCWRNVLQMHWLI